VKLYSKNYKLTKSDSQNHYKWIKILLQIKLL